MIRCAHCFGELTQFAVFCPHCSQTHELDLTQLINQTIGSRYRLYRRMGQGGLSTVFAATDLQTDSVLVVKVSDPAQLVRRELTYAIDAEAAKSYWGEMLERMRREAETLACVDHPNIVKFYETGLIGDDLRYVVMEFLRGRTLREVLNEKGRLDSNEAIRVALDICAALEEIHRRGIVHRDINPSNVMIVDCGMRDADSQTVRSHQSDFEYSSIEETEATHFAIRNPHSAIKLIDFGIAKFPQPPGAPPFTQHSVLSGTVSYASPEQCQSRAVDHRSDIYSLGVMLYEMLTDERPFTGRTPTEIALKQIQDEPVPPRQLNAEIPANLEKAILRAMAKSPDERQQSITDLVEAISRSARQIVAPLQAEEFTESEAIPFAEHNTGESDEVAVDRAKLVRRRRRRLALAVATLVVAMVVAGAMLGKNWFASRIIEPLMSGSSNSQSSNDIQGGQSGFLSDADSLEELAAQLPADGLAAKMQLPQAHPNGTVQSAAGKSPIVNSGNASSNVPARTVIASAPKPSPLPTPMSPKSQRQTASNQTPAANPTRSPQPVTQPAGQTETAPTARRAEENTTLKRDTADSANNDKTNTTNNPVQPTASRDRIASNRNRSDEDNGYRRYPSTRSQEPDDDEEPYRDEPQQIGPKLIQWSGSVNREREITIELPGVPGTLEIPRVYRDRVGIVEPPSASNRWRCARLRVFGKGGVSIVVRWWPSSYQTSRLAGQ